MLMVTTVLRRGLVRKDFVVSHIVTIDAVTCRTANDQMVRIAQVAYQGRYSYVHHVITKASAIWPTAGNETAIVERVLNVAVQDIATEDAQPRESWIIRISWITRATPGKTHLAG